MAEESNDTFESLLIEWEDGRLDEAGMQGLREILREDPDAQERFVQYQMLKAAMHLEGQVHPEGNLHPDARTGLPPESASEIRPQKPSDHDHPGRRRTWRSGGWFSMLVAVAAVILVCSLLGRWAVLETRIRQADNTDPDQTAPPPQSVEATSQGIALVTRLVDATWADDGESQNPTVGDALTPGRLALRSGYAQVEFFCGATVVLEGPAELELLTATSAKFQSGRLRAQVPPAARGFEILVDEMKVVDLGTEFGISVTPDGADVQVFDGEVELHRPAAEKRLVTAGQAVMHDREGNLGTAELTPGRFVDLETLDTHAQNQIDGRFQRWQDYSARLRQDDRLIAYYALDDPDRWNRKLVSSVVPTDHELDGAIVGARRVAGRWPQKSALEFRRPGDRVRVQIPGEFRSLTLACWVKIDSLDRFYNSLFLTDNYQEGEPHWQILQNGRLQFTVRVPADEGPKHKEVQSPVFWNPAMSGQWLHLATTYDVDRQTATNFLNGQPLNRVPIPDHQVAKVTRFGKASIGNWALPTRANSKFAIRNLNGTIDEFVLFAAALSDAEIAEMYENGKP